MAWARLQYNQRDVNKAGEYLRQYFLSSQLNHEEYSRAIKVVNNFRVAHAFPLNTIQNNLRIRAVAINEKNIIAQRLKRISSILTKLDRFPTMDLWQMQDIGGCRAIVRNLDDVEQLVKSYKSSSIRHRLTNEHNYIEKPRSSGYRSWHLIYSYFSDRNDVYNGLKIEIQIRTPLQHAWATTVETVDAFTSQALKSSRGRSDWERFFQLMGSEMAFQERTPVVENTPSDRKELLKELRHCAQELQVLDSLAGFATALNVTHKASAEGKDAYFLLSLDNINRRLKYTGYKTTELERAAKAYSRQEERIRTGKGVDAVLVSVDYIRNLKRAYPNYFADTRLFSRVLREAIR
jgi:ppGpp synthetase/RelA/SpoT-type nucleotidyltranferase